MSDGLEALRTVREAARAQAERHLAEALDARDAVRAEVQDARARLTRAPEGDAMPTEPLPGAWVEASARAGQRARDRRERARGQLRDALVRWAEADDRVGSAIRALGDTHLAQRVVEEHLERRARAARLVQNRREDDELDERQGFLSPA